MRLAAYTPGRSATNDGREVLAPDNVAELPSGLLVSVHAKIRSSVAVLSSKDPVPSSVTSWPAWIDCTGPAFAAGAGPTCDESGVKVRSSKAMSDAGGRVSRMEWIFGL